MAQPQPPPQIPEVKTIMLLEENKINNNDPNGTFSINLPHPIVIKEGDEIALNHAFIDTSLQDLNFIEVDDDEQDITISTGIYYTDIQANVNDLKPSWGKWSVPDADRPNGDSYILSNQSEASLNTFLDWNVTNQPTIGVGTAFNLRLATLESLDPTDPLIGIAQYKLVGDPPTTLTPTDPPGFGQVVEEQFLLGGYLNMTTANGEHEFLYYHRTTTEAQFAIQNMHVAVFSGWFDTTKTPPTRLGWKAKANPDTIFPPTTPPPYYRWYFESDPLGFNYFSDRGSKHIVKLQTLRFPLYRPWKSLDSLTSYPAVQLQYVDDTTGKTIPVTKNFNKYPPTRTEGGGFDTSAAMDTLTDTFRTTGKNERIKHEALQPQFQSGNGWGRDWHWYDWKQWQDPLDKTGVLTFPSVEFSIDDPPVLHYANFDPNGHGRDQGFINVESQHAVRNKAGIVIGEEIQPWQMPDLLPVSSPTSNGSTMTPREYTTTIRVTKGNYTYTELAELITDQLNSLNTPVTGLKNNPDDPNQPPNAAGYSNSYLLQTTYELMMQYDGLSTIPIADPPIFPNNFTFSKVRIDTRVAPDGTIIREIDPQTATSKGVQPYFVSEDGQKLFSFDKDAVFPGGTDKPFIVGAENFSLIFDDTTNQFKFEQIHTPIYIDGPVIDSSTNPPTKGPGSVVIQQFKAAATDASFLGTLKTIDSSTGCFITDLQPRSLWFDKMGFNHNILTSIGTQNSNLINFTDTGSSFSGGDLEEVRCFPLSLTTGINKTGYYISNDSLITKNNNYYELDDAWNEKIETDELVGLEGESLIVATSDQGFYQVEISGMNQQSISGQVYENSLVQAVVGKYFSEGSFTSSIGDGLPYVHQGEPLVIKSLRVRVLDTQNELEPNLGPHSSFTLTINTNK